MNITDSIADLLTRIRNALSAGHVTVDIPSSKLKITILKICVLRGSSESSQDLKMVSRGF